MQSIRYVYWQDGDAWLGHLEEYPDYLTQGESLSDLEEHLRDLRKDLSSGVIPSVRKLAELPASEWLPMKAKTGAELAALCRCAFTSPPQGG